jgi:Na+/melibiose symporter-like transporter
MREAAERRRAPRDGLPSKCASRQPIPFLDKVYYGVGQYGEGVQGAAANALLLFYYNQVVGLNAALVGAGIMLTAVFNALLDVFIGPWSDLTRHRWGRRHPYLYWAPIPAAVSMIALFAAPHGLPVWASFVWLFFWYTLMRIGMTVYLVPHWALGAEISQDYHERTSIVSSRIFFSYLGTGTFFVISLLFFNSRSGGANTLFQSSPYLYVAGFTALIVLLTEVGSAFGTHRYIPRLPARIDADKAATIGTLWAEIRGVFANKAFVIFFVGSIIMAIAAMSSRALDLYLGTYFWRLPSNFTLILPGFSILSFAGGTFVWAAVARRIGKKRTFILGVVGYGAVMTVLPALKIAGLFLPATSPLYFPLILGVSMVANLSFSAYGVMSAALLPDVVDDYYRQTGRRMAGAVTGFLFVIVTVGTAGSQLLVSLVLTLIDLAPKALPDTVPVQVSNKLGILSASIAAATTVAFALIFRNFPIGQPKESG